MDLENSKYNGVHTFIAYGIYSVRRVLFLVCQIVLWNVNSVVSHQYTRLYIFIGFSIVFNQWQNFTHRKHIYWWNMYICHKIYMLNRPTIICAHNVAERTLYCHCYTRIHALSHSIQLFINHWTLLDFLWVSSSLSLSLSYKMKVWKFIA